MKLSNFILTRAGRNASVSAADAGLKLIFREVAVGRIGYTADGTEVALQDEVLRAPIEAGSLNPDTDTLEWHALLFSDSTFDIREIGVFVDNPDPNGEPVLALIWSHETDVVAHLTESEELYLSAAIKLSNIDTSIIEINTPAPEARYLLKSEFDKYVQKSSVADEFTVDYALEQHAMPSYLMVKRIKEDVDILKAEQESINLRSFPKYFGYATTRTEDAGYDVPHYNDLIRPPANADNQGFYSFFGGKFFLLGRTFTIPAFETNRIEKSFTALTANILQPESEDDRLIAAFYDIDVGDKVFFVLETDFSRTQDDYTLSSVKIRVIRPEDYNEQDLSGDSITSPLQIKLAEYTKDSSETWHIRNIANAPLIDKYSTITLDANIARHYTFEPSSPYVVRVSASSPSNRSIKVETKGLRTREGYIACSWEAMSDARVYLGYKSFRSKEVLNIYKDREANLHITTLTQDMSSPIGTILAWHKNIMMGLLLPYGWFECNGQIIDLADGTSITVPNLNNPYRTYNSKGSFLRGHTESGEFEEDSLQEHTHRDRGHQHALEPGIRDNNDGLVTAGSDPGQRLPPTKIGYANLGGAASYSIYGSPRVARETRPVNMSVVWIIRLF